MPKKPVGRKPKLLSQLPGTKQPQPELEDLASLIRDTIADHKQHWKSLKARHSTGPASIYQMAKAIGMSNSTLSNISLAYYPPDTKFIRSLAEELNRLEAENARSEHRKAKAITPDLILSLIPDSYRERKAAEQRSVKISRQLKPLEGKTIYLQWMRLTAEQRAPFWPRMLKAAAQDLLHLEAVEEPPLKQLQEAIASLQKEMAAADLDQFVAALLARENFLPTHPEGVPLREGLAAILEEGRYPDFSSAAYATVGNYLAKYLEGGKFAGDTEALISSYFGEPSEVVDPAGDAPSDPPATEKRSAQAALRAARKPAQKRQK